MDQLYATTKRRIRPSYLDAIRAQAPYLPLLYQQRKDEELANRQLALEEAGLEASKSQATALTDIEREALEQRKKASAAATSLGLGKMGVDVGFHLYGEGKKAGIAPKIASTTGDMPRSFLNPTGLTDWGKWGSAMKTGDPFLAGGAGTIISGLVGGSKTKKALIGAGTGALAGALLSKGDPYSSVLSAILGGLGGLF